MSIRLNTQLCNYVRSLFEHPSKLYESYQENGTKYLKLRRKLDDQLQEQLNACTGEIFLCGIPPDVQAEKIAEVASLVGEVYILRFKVHFSGASRGYAYLQYVDHNVMQLALQQLPGLFAMLQLRSIKVCTSRNSSKLLLRKVFDMDPKMVYETLTKLITFEHLISHELYPGYFEYQIIFKCNEVAVLARREILKSILKFGNRAIVIWDASCRGYNPKLRTPLKDSAHRKMCFPHQENRREMNALQQVPANNVHQKFSPQNDKFVNEFRNMKLF